MHKSSALSWGGCFCFGLPALGELGFYLGRFGSAQSWDRPAPSKQFFTQNFVSSIQFIFAFSPKLSLLTIFALFLSMVSSPIQLEQQNMIFLFYGCLIQKKVLYILWPLVIYGLFWAISLSLLVQIIVTLIFIAFWQLECECWLAAILITRKKIYVCIFTVCCLLSLHYLFVYAQHF